MTIESAPIDQIPVQPVKSLADRREARRRKILENAENRLKKLTGVEQKSHVLIDDFKPIAYEEDCTDGHHNDSLTVNENLPSLPLNFIDQTTPVVFTNNKDDTSENKSKYNKLTSLLAISLISNILQCCSAVLCDESLSFGCNMIFLPFIGWEFLEYYNKRISPPENNVLHLLLMAYMKNDNLKRIFMYMLYLTSFMQDLCIYFFLFVSMNQVFKVVLILR